MTVPVVLSDEMVATIDVGLASTRTIRRRLNLKREVPSELINDCVEVASQAPSGSARNAAHWIVITDRSKISAIGDIYAEVFSEYRASPTFEGLLFADDPIAGARQRRVGESATWLGAHMRDVPAMVIPCIQIGGPLFPGSQAGLWGQILPAAWSFAVAARARGVGTAWTTMHLRREPEVASILGLPRNVHQGVLMPLGFIDGAYLRRAWREPVESIIHRDGWNSALDIRGPSAT
jgi:nitroreductase